VAHERREPEAAHAEQRGRRRAHGCAAPLASNAGTTSQYRSAKRASSDEVRTTRQRRRLRFNAPREEQTNGSRTGRDDREDQDAPAAVQAARVPGNLLGEVRGQMMRNCDSEKYATTRTKAKRSFPRSWRIDGVMTSERGAIGDRRGHRDGERQRPRTQRP
jgi:hypothetical protein